MHNVALARNLLNREILPEHSDLIEECIIKNNLEVKHSAQNHIKYCNSKNNPNL